MHEWKIVRTSVGRHPCVHCLNYGVHSQVQKIYHSRCSKSRDQRLNPMQLLMISVILLWPRTCHIWIPFNLYISLKYSETLTSWVLYDLLKRDLPSLRGSLIEHFFFFIFQQRLLLFYGVVKIPSANQFFCIGSQFPQNQLIFSPNILLLCAVSYLIWFY